MTKTAFITVAGWTNAGKSSLLNAVVGEKIASVSSKPQTTRTRITGICNIDQTQLVFFDTPGLHKPTSKLSSHMLKTVKDSVSDIDGVIYMLDCTKKISEPEYAMLDRLHESSVPVILVPNKIDLLKDKAELFKVIAELSDRYDFQAVVPVSVLKNDGVDVLISEVLKLATESPYHFPEEMFTDQPEKVLAAEFIREKLLIYLEDEIPHGVAVGIEKLKEREDRDLLDIEAVIYCEKDSHKGIIIGKSGNMLKKISTAARAELEDFFRIQVNLQCWVKVKEDWRNREGIIRNFGLNNSK